MQKQLEINDSKYLCCETRSNEQTRKRLAIVYLQFILRVIILQLFEYSDVLSKCTLFVCIFVTIIVVQLYFNYNLLF